MLKNCVIFVRMPVYPEKSTVFVDSILLHWGNETVSIAIAVHSAQPIQIFKTASQIHIHTMRMNERGAKLTKYCIILYAQCTL